MGGLYLAKLMKPKDALDEEIEKLDAALALGGDEMRPYVRPTKFVIPEANRGLFTARQRQYSSLLGGTQTQRRKFLRKKNHQVDINESQSVDDISPSPVAATPPASTGLEKCVPAQATHRRRRPKRVSLDE
ncbi:hypothetical protein H310_04280 [Aphanomyces invadans]|uniref:Uncharacterized protein n=1 Tax=Aphanomyces invadans TaxID=157072 RepID=A0A024UG21_9STRA|nr:hypothetical protein H310_04280 [Aphanomyces invadans]ETW05341.1 hypothetical protein H310_04280 [Aphanomyces invadans]|eukprot:XP_008866779.1 hypothetical protein H310_04280 [Aphanomyces invadans]